ncbi:ArsR/SmtB family transcription factor [Nitrosomonas halophila]|uniref:DNA-binding transcriptional regulator, ArsR family n=1 Tax=Nitrosomonas halophila TaxID=44576 RepID=A0A1H3C3H7_9PROT|nr:DNA-binding transcriptional regulator, ArsR family [Nitrosomonas halophila]
MINSSAQLPDLSAMIEERAAAVRACAMLRILANEDRLLILCKLMQGRKNVGELEQQLGIRQPTLSQQLTVLREEKLVSTERQGKYIYYSLASPEAIQIMLTLFNLYCQDSGLQAARNSHDTTPFIDNLFERSRRTSGGAASR